MSSNVLKISIISQVRSMSENSDIFNTRNEIFLVFPKKKVNFLFRASLNFFLVISRQFRLALRWYNFGRELSLDLENDL